MADVLPPNRRGLLGMIPPRHQKSMGFLKTSFVGCPSARYDPGDGIKNDFPAGSTVLGVKPANALLRLPLFTVRNFGQIWFGIR